jgi:hypothetical protein
MIDPIMPYRNVNIFREKEAKSFSKKVIVGFLCCHLIQNEVTI